MIGSDDVLACFVAGNAFTWDDWFRLETLDDSLQPTIDMLLNLSVFLWFGAICPWHSFLENGGIIPLYRLIFLGILILLFRRLPIVFAMHKYINQIEQKRQAIFVGFFGPIGVSAIFYLYISLEFLENIRDEDGHQRPDAKKLGDTMMIVVWFLCICSIVVHGISIPLSKMGLGLTRTLSQRFDSSASEDPQPFRIRRRVESSSTAAGIFRRRGQSSGTSTPAPSGTASDRQVFGIGGSIIRDEPSSLRDELAGTATPRDDERPAPVRTIRFPDEAALAAK
jgi:hypothetical protein